MTGKAMPEIIEDTAREGRQNVMPALKYWAATRFGEAFVGGPGYAVGGAVAGGHIGGSEGNVLTQLAIAEGIDLTFGGGR